MSRFPAPRRWVMGALVVGLVLVLVGWFVRSVVIRDRARAVPAEEVIDDFRTSTLPPATNPPATAPTTPPDSGALPTTVGTGGSTPPPPTVAPTVAPSPAVPEPGVYRYRTTGSEQIDALGGTTHVYPAETTITVVAEGCGVRVRWDALRERRDEWRLCATSLGIELQPDGLHFHEFYGQAEEEDLACDVAVLIVPADDIPPAPVSQSCRLADDPWTPTWEVLERAIRSVDGRDVDVRHVRMTIDDDDEYWERLVTDWYLTSSGLPVEVTTAKESRSPTPVGAVIYSEDYRLELVSTVPLR